MSEINLNGDMPQEDTAPAQEGEQLTPDLGAADQDTQGRTFTQDEINRIISRRVAEERAKADAQLKQREAELVQREYEYHVQTTLKDKKLLPQLADILKGGDKATFDKSLAGFEELLKEQVQAGVIERLKGSTPTVAMPMPTSPQETIRGAMGLHKKE